MAIFEIEETFFINYLEPKNTIFDQQIVSKLLSTLKNGHFEEIGHGCKFWNEDLIVKYFT